MTTDTAITEAAEGVLKRHAPWMYRVWLTATEGYVTLLGELEWEHERRNIEQAIRAIPGVTGICNLITLSEPAIANIDFDASVQSSI